MDSCNFLLSETLQLWGIILLRMPLCANTSKFHSWFPDDPTAADVKLDSNYDDDGIINQIHHISVKEAIRSSEA